MIFADNKVTCEVVHLFESCSINRLVECKPVCLRHKGGSGRFVQILSILLHFMSHVWHVSDSIIKYCNLSACSCAVVFSFVFYYVKKFTGNG